MAKHFKQGARRSGEPFSALLRKWNSSDNGGPAVGRAIPLDAPNSPPYAHCFFQPSTCVSVGRTMPTPLRQSYRQQVGKKRGRELRWTDPSDPATQKRTSTNSALDTFQRWAAPSHPPTPSGDLPFFQPAQARVRWTESVHPPTQSTPLRLLCPTQVLRQQEVDFP